MTRDQRPAPGRPFPAAARGGGLLSPPGPVAQDRPPASRPAADTAPQAGQIPRTTTATPAATGTDLDDLIRAGADPTGTSQPGAMNQAHRTHYAAPCPARTTIGAAAPPPGATAEIDAGAGSGQRPRDA